LTDQTPLTKIMRFPNGFNSGKQHQPIWLKWKRTNKKCGHNSCGTDWDNLLESLLKFEFRSTTFADKSKMIFMWLICGSIFKRWNSMNKLKNDHLSRALFLRFLRPKRLYFSSSLKRTLFFLSSFVNMLVVSRKHLMFSSF
jgi:hypothetical protein